MVALLVVCGCGVAVGALYFVWARTNKPKS